MVQKVMCSQCQKKPAVGAILQKFSAEEKKILLKAREKTDFSVLFIGEYYLVGKYCEDNLTRMAASMKQDPENWERTKVVTLDELQNMIELEGSKKGKET